MASGVWSWATYLKQVAPFPGAWKIVSLRAGLGLWAMQADMPGLESCFQNVYHVISSKLFNLPVPNYSSDMGIIIKCDKMC